jgi:hypothetical protein
MWLLIQNSKDFSMSRLSTLKSNLAAHLIVVAALAALGPSTALAAGQTFEPPAATAEVTVSDRDWNHFIFSEKVVRGPYFPDAAPIPAGSKPVWLAGNSQFLIQVQRGAGDKFQMVVETESGAVHKLYLKPAPVAGATHKVRGSPGSAGSAGRPVQPAAEPGRGGDVELLRRIVQGDVPADFVISKLPIPVRFDAFTAVPMIMWDGNDRRVAVFNLVSVGGKSSVVAPPQFYRPGVTAVLIDGDTVAPGVATTLYVMEAISHE